MTNKWNGRTMGAEPTGDDDSAGLNFGGWKDIQNKQSNRLSDYDLGDEQPQPQPQPVPIPIPVPPTTVQQQQQKGNLMPVLAGVAIGAAGLWALQHYGIIGSGSRRAPKMRFDDEED